jgi:ACT domain-containing protein
MEDEPGDRPQAHTVRLELVDEPGELLRALEPIAANGGNLLSIFHERGSLTPRGHIPVEVDLECPPDRFPGIIDALRDAGVNVIRADRERYGEAVTLLLIGDLIDTDLSDTLTRVESTASATVVDLSVSGKDGTDDVSSARMRLAVATGNVSGVLDAVRDIAVEKDLQVVEPLVGES